MADALRVIFHAGFHKTGTSSLQQALRAHANGLAPQWQIAVLEGGSRPLRQAAQAARQFSTHADAAALQDAMAHWAASLNLQPGQGLLLSSEDFAGHMPGHRRVRSYAAAPQIAVAMATALRARFGAVDLRLLYTTRAPADWLRSVHWQLAKHDAMLLDAATYARRFAAAADLPGVVQRVRNALPDVQVAEVALEDLATRPLGPVDALFDLAGVDPALRATLAPVRQANAAPPWDLAETFVALNRSDLPADLRRLMKQALRDLARAATPETGVETR